MIWSQAKEVFKAPLWFRFVLVLVFKNEQTNITQLVNS